MSLINKQEILGVLERLNTDNKYRISVAVTGAGAGLQRLIWDLPGISRSLISGTGNFPYRPTIIDKFVGGQVGKYLSFKAAHELAAKAYFLAQEAVFAEKTSAQPVGLGASAAVQTDRTRKGPDKVFIVVHMVNQVFEVEIDFHKTGTREVQGEACDLACLNMLFSALGYPQVGDQPVVPHQVIPAISDQEVQFLDETGNPGSADPGSLLLVPGAGNLWTFGHAEIARMASSYSAKQAVFGLTVTNAVKASIPEEEAARRIVQLLGHKSVIIRNAPLYFDLFQKGFRTFVIGGDKVEQILDPKYTEGRITVPGMLELFRYQGVHFYVVPRIDRKTGKMLSSKIPHELQDLFEILTVRVDVSSSELRELVATESK